MDEDRERAANDAAHLPAAADDEHRVSWAQPPQQSRRLSRLPCSKRQGERIDAERDSRVRLRLGPELRHCPERRRPVVAWQRVEQLAAHEHGLAGELRKAATCLAQRLARFVDLAGAQRLKRAEEPPGALGALAEGVAATCLCGASRALDEGPEILPSAAAAIEHRSARRLH